MAGPDIWGKLAGGALSGVTDAVGSIVRLWHDPPGDKADRDQERWRAEMSEAVEALRQTHAVALGQLKVNAAEARHRSVWVAGWRPAVGWICALGLFVAFPLRWTTTLFGLDVAPLDTNDLMPILIGMLGLGTMRSVEKVQAIRTNGNNNS